MLHGFRAGAGTTAPHQADDVDPHRVGGPDGGLDGLVRLDALDPRIHLDEVEAVP